MHYRHSLSNINTSILAFLVQDLHYLKARNFIRIITFKNAVDPPKPPWFSITKTDQSGVQNGMTSLALHLAVMGLHTYSWSKWQWPLVHVQSKSQSQSLRFIAKQCNHSCILSWKSLPTTQVKSFQACMKYLKLPSDLWNQSCRKAL